MDFPNMSYVMFENTADAMNQIMEALDSGQANINALGERECDGARRLLHLCREFVSLCEDEDF